MDLRRLQTWFVYSLFIVVSLGGLWLILALGNDHVARLGNDTASGDAVALSSFDNAQREQTKTPSVTFLNPLSLLLLQVIVIVVCARVCGFLAHRVGQPRVIGEIAAGILLGPSLLGFVSPQISHWLFPSDSLSELHILSQIGLLLFMFIVGMEVNVASLKSHAREALWVSHASVVFPFLLGAALAIGLFETYASSGAEFITFALFMGIAMSVTAFPVLARILMDRGLSKSPLGTLALTCAAVDDVTAWCLLALIVAIAQAGSVLGASYIILFGLIYVAVMVRLIKPAVERRLGRSEIDQRVVATVLLTVLTSALATELIGLHALFGAFLAGVVMPQQEQLRRAIAERVEDLSTLILLPLFFAFTGLRTEVGLLDDPQSWLVCGIIIVVAVLGKLAGSALTARWSGMPWSDSLALGVLMNTRGLMELVVLNLGYDLGILSAELFTMMVIMALVTTLMTGPLLSFIGRQKRKGDTSKLSFSPEAKSNDVGTAHISTKSSS